MQYSLSQATLRSLILLTTVLACAVPYIAQAQYAVDPLVLDHTVSPRDNISSTLTIQNTGNRIERLYAIVNAVTLDGEGGIESFAPRSQVDNRTTVTSWLAVERGRIEVPPGERYEVPVNLSIHPQAEPGVYHAYIGFAAGRNRDIAEERVRDGQAPGSIVRIEVAEDRTSYLRLDRFDTDRFILNPEQSEIRYTVENPGDIPHTPRGEVIIYDTRGNEVAAAPVNPDADVIAPGETKEFRTAIPEIDRMGRHRAYLSLTYGEGQLASLQDTIFFFRVPITHLILIFVLTLVVACAVAYMVHRRYMAVEDGADEDDFVALYHRPGERSEGRGHDLDLTQGPRPNNSETPHDHDRP